MEAKHTPAPWVARTSIDPYSPTLAERWEVVHDRENGSTRYAAIIPGTDEAAMPESEANARLIAASPAMYAALECEEASIDDRGFAYANGVFVRNGWDCHEPVNRFLARLRRAALSLARGDTPTPTPAPYGPHNPPRDVSKRASPGSLED